MSLWGDFFFVDLSGVSVGWGVVVVRSPRITALASDPAVESFLEDR